MFGNKSKHYGGTFSLDVYSISDKSATVKTFIWVINLESFYIIQWKPRNATNIVHNIITVILYQIILSEK